MSLIKRLLIRNVGTLDRILRTAPAIAFLIVWATGALSGVALVVLGILAAILLVTAVTARCSIYAMFGLSTCSIKHARS